MVLSSQAPKAYTPSLQTRTATTRNLLLSYFLLMGLGLLVFYVLAVATLAVVLGRTPMVLSIQAPKAYNLSMCLFLGLATPGLPHFS